MTIELKDYPTTWWVVTDKMTPFIDGVSSPIYRSQDGSIEVPYSHLPIGALWVIKRDEGLDKNQYPRLGLDGLAIACKMSDHAWHIEGRASNCTKKDDNEHRCWCRHGTFGEKLTVNKFGLTCAAGAGSVYMDDQKWHGYLKEGVLVYKP